MKNVLVLSLMILLSIPAISQSRKYNKAMLSAIDKMNQSTDPAAGLELAATFEELSQLYPDQWFPAYHASHVLINSSFAEPDGVKSDALLERALKSMESAMKIAPEESELYALKALYFIGVISADPASRGQVYYQDVLDAIQRSKNLDPDNPRAFLLDGMMMSNLPEFLGGGPEAAKAIFLEADKKFKAFQNDDPLWPSWGAELNQTELENLK